MKTSTLSLLSTLWLAGILHAQEPVLDSDHDGLPDALELTLGTNPFDADSDHDGLSDGDEVNRYLTDPLNLDTDGDGLYDGEEIAAGTNPFDTDSDDDGLPDGLELSASTDPLDLDTDDDGAYDGEELTAETDPDRPDSDADGLKDGLELSAHTNPLSRDTDDDGLYDGTELALELDPTTNTLSDTGETDQQQLVHASHPEMVATTPVGQPHAVQFTALPYVSYDVLFSNDLQHWEILQQLSPSPTGTLQTVPEPIAGSTRGFFTLKPH